MKRTMLVLLVVEESETPAPIETTGETLEDEVSRLVPKATIAKCGKVVDLAARRVAVAK